MAGIAILNGSLLLAGAAWLAVGARLYWGLQGVPQFDANDPLPPLASAPRVTLIAAARNEEDALPAALESFLNLDYPDYEVILVDDDSTDRTGAIADEWARRPEAQGKLRIIHNHSVPPGWRGKVHALHLAEQAATGEWILATDADVIFHPSALRRAMALAQRDDAQLVTLTPDLEFDSLAEKAVLPAFSILLSGIYPPRLVNDRGSGKALAIGAFILMRREDLEALGGYAKLRGSVVEDLKMAKLFKAGGRRLRYAVAHGLLRTKMYRGWGEMFEGLSRCAFEPAGNSLANILGEVVVENGMAVLPWAAAVARFIYDRFHGVPALHDPTLILALAACAACTTVYMPVLHYFRASPAMVLFLPAASVFYSCAALHSAFATLFGGGVTWKGRRYRTDT